MIPDKTYRLEYCTMDDEPFWALLIRKRFLWIGYWAVVSVKKDLSEIEALHKTLTTHPINKP